MGCSSKVPVIIAQQLEPCPKPEPLELKPLQYQYLDTPDNILILLDNKALLDLFLKNIYSTIKCYEQQIKAGGK